MFLNLSFLFKEFFVFFFPFCLEEPLIRHPLMMPGLEQHLPRKELCVLTSPLPTKHWPYGGEKSGSAWLRDRERSRERRRRREACWISSESEIREVLTMEGKIRPQTSWRPRQQEEIMMSLFPKSMNYPANTLESISFVALITS